MSFSAVIVYKLRVLLIHSATHAELSMMYDPRAKPIIT
jgi:hypothetical protein